MIYPEQEKGGRGKLSPEGTVKKQMLHKARAVLNTEFVTPILEGRTVKKLTGCGTGRFVRFSNDREAIMADRTKRLP